MGEGEALPEQELVVHVVSKLRKLQFLRACGIGALQVEKSFPNPPQDRLALGGPRLILLLWRHVMEEDLVPDHAPEFQVIAPLDVGLDALEREAAFPRRVVVTVEAVVLEEGSTVFSYSINPCGGAAPAVTLGTSRRARARQIGPLRPGACRLSSTLS